MFSQPRPPSARWGKKVLVAAGAAAAADTLLVKGEEQDLQKLTRAQQLCLE